MILNKLNKQRVNISVYMGKAGREISSKDAQIKNKHTSCAAKKTKQTNKHTFAMKACVSLQQNYFIICGDSKTIW